MDSLNSSTSGSSENYTAPAGAERVYEGLVVTLEKPPFIKRFLAYVTDFAIVSSLLYGFFVIILIVVVMLAGVSAGIRDAGSESLAEMLLGFGAIAAVLITMIVTAFVMHGYFIYHEYKSGTTFGKRIFGIRVVSADGDKLSLSQCIVRDFMRYVDCMLLIPGFLSIQLSKNGQRLGDMLANSRVVYSKSQEKEIEHLYMGGDAYFAMLERIKPQAIQPGLAQQYLTYAYPTFVLQKLAEPGPLQQLPFEYLKDCDTSQYSSEEIQLFFAEFCFQSFTYG